MSPIHIRADPTDLAPIALLVGDPGRAHRIAEWLDRPQLYNDFRGLIGYTGDFDGTPISVQTTGMGGPSAALVLEELAQLGVRTAIRVGTCGSVGPDVGVLELVIATAAVPLDGTSRAYSDGDPIAPVADFTITRTLAEEASRMDRTHHVGLIATHDAFYHQADAIEAWRARGVLAVEMEAAALFTVAPLRNVRMGAICLTVDSVGVEGTWQTDESIAKGTDDLVEVALRTAARLAPEP